MGTYSEQDLRYAAEFRGGVHAEALEIVRRSCPEIREVVDRHPVEDYFQEHWDYPGKWYTIVAIPYGYRSRQALVQTIARDTLLGCSAGKTEERRAPRAEADDSASAVLDAYPDLAIAYRIVPNRGRYWGYESHREALKQFASDGEGRRGNPVFAVGKRISCEELFSSRYREGELNYRKAFLYPPRGNRYTGQDFAYVNAALFPNGTAGLEVYEWSTDWSDWFEAGRNGRGALCLTVYDESCDRFVVIAASGSGR